MFEINIRTLQRWLYEYKKMVIFKEENKVIIHTKQKKKCKIYHESFEKKSIYPNWHLKLKSKYPDVNITERHLRRIVREIT